MTDDSRNADLEFRLALILTAAQRPLSTSEIRDALLHGSHDEVKIEQIMRALTEGPFHPVGGKWGLGEREDESDR